MARCILFFPVCTMRKEIRPGHIGLARMFLEKKVAMRQKKIAKANALEEYSTEFMLSDREIRCDEEDLDTS